MAELPQVRPQRCMHFCTKAMIVHGEGFEEAADFEAGASTTWCLATSKPLGPDYGDVSLDACSDPQRSCYREY
jgi:hypothetical protein